MPTQTCKVGSRGSPSTPSTFRHGAAGQHGAAGHRDCRRPCVPRRDHEAQAHAAPIALGMQHMATARHPQCGHAGHASLQTQLLSVNLREQRAARWRQGRMDVALQSATQGPPPAVNSLTQCPMPTQSLGRRSISQFAIGWAVGEATRNPAAGEASPSRATAFNASLVHRPAVRVDRLPPGE